MALFSETGVLSYMGSNLSNWYFFLMEMTWLCHFFRPGNFVQSDFAIQISTRFAIFRKDAESFHIGVKADMLTLLFYVGWGFVWPLFDP